MWNHVWEKCAFLTQVEDAQAAMRLYTMHRKEWERSIKEKRQPSKQKKKRLIKSIKGEAEVPVWQTDTFTEQAEVLVWQRQTMWYVCMELFTKRTI